MINFTLTSIGLLVLRVSVSVMMMTHGLAKLQGFSAISQEFLDPIGVGKPVALMMAIFAEFFCSILVALGLFTRIAVIPLIVTMLVAAFVAHAPDPFEKKELALMYLTAYVTLLATGSGIFGLDRFINIGKRRN